MTLSEARGCFQVQGIDNAFLAENASEQEEAFKNCIRLLEGVEQTKNICRAQSSYGLKHYAEDPANMFSRTGADPCTYTGYVYEGTLILAALALGFRCKYGGTKSMACYFNISGRSLRAKVRRMLDEARKAAKDGRGGETEVVAATDDAEGVGSKTIPMITHEETFYGYVVGLSIEPRNEDGYWSHHMYAVFQFNGSPVTYEVPDSTLFKLLAEHLIEMTKVRDASYNFGSEKLWIKKEGDMWDVCTP